MNSSTQIKAFEFRSFGALKFDSFINIFDNQYDKHELTLNIMITQLREI